MFLVAPPGDGPYAGAVIGVGHETVVGDPPAWRGALYGCDERLTCVTPLATFPIHESVVFADLAADFPRSGIVQVVTEGADEHLWMSRDGGAHAPLVSGAQQVMSGLARALHDGITPDARVATDPAHPGRVYLRVATGHDSPAVPIEQMYRSDDWGAHFRLIGFARLSGKPGPQGAPGWPGGTGWPTGGFDLERMLVLSGGRILAVGSGAGGSRVFCSTDGARTWNGTCR
jgi:hypothetical protein